MYFRTVFYTLVASYLGQEKGRTLLTLLGVALGVAVLVGIDLANESAVTSFKSTVADVAGAAQLTVRGNSIGLPGSLVNTLARDPEVAGVSPLITGYLYHPAKDGRTTETLLLLGTDFLRSEEPEDLPIRDLRFTRSPNRDVRDFLVDPTLLVFTKRFAEKHGYTLESKVPLQVGGNVSPFVMGGLIDTGSFTDTLDGNIVTADIATADLLLRRSGRVDRIDIILRPGVDVNSARDRLQRELPGSILVERPETRSTQVDNMMAAFRFNLRALGHLSILVGAFLVYNTMSIAVVRRRFVIGTLRAMGVKAGTIRLVFLAEGALIGLVGSLVGIVLGIGMAAVMLETVTAAISINFFQTQASSVVPAPGLLFMAMLVGVVGSMIAALRPAQEAASTPPANTMRRGSEESNRLSSLLLFLLGAALGAGGIILLLREATPGLPLQGYAASVLLLGMFALWCRPVLEAVASLLRAPYSRLFRAEGLLSVAGTQAMPGRAAIAICGLMISLAMSLSVSVMVASFRGTVIDWMEQVLQADLYISPLSEDALSRADPMPVRIAEALATVPGIGAVDPFRTRSFIYNGMPANLGAGNLAVARFGNKVLDGRPTRAALLAARDAGEVIASEAFARKHGLKKGDTIALPTPNGDIQVRIGAVYYDYSSEQGYVIMDRAQYLKHYDDDLIDSVAVYLKDGADRKVVRRLVEKKIAGLQGIPAVSIRANDELRAFALRAFDQTFAVTSILQAIAIIVAILGVATTLLAQIIDRRQEVATLRTLGASSGRVARMIVLESSIIGIVGLILGLVSGILLSWILARVIMLQSFGWTISFAIPWFTVFQISALVFVCTLLAAALPAREALRSGSGIR